jgi:hypothetical protein
MQCPACRAQAPEDATECSYCGLIFAKWKGKPTGTPPPAPSEVTPAGTAEEAVPAALPPTARMNGSTIALLVTLLVLAAASLYFLLKPSPPRPAVEARQIRPLGWPTEPVLPTPTQGPEEVYRVVWRFEGKVFDNLHQVPIQGVTVTLDLNPPVVVMTDAEGAYSAAATVSEGSKGVYIWLNHPDFGSNYQVGDHTMEPYEQRIRMFDVIQFQGSHPGNPVSITHLDFSMFPAKLTEEEDQKLRDTLYPPARD